MSEEELKFGADAFLAKLHERKTIVDNFFTGIKLTGIALGLVKYYFLGLMLDAYLIAS